MDHTYIARIARAAHEVNRAYCEALGDPSQLPWLEAPGWQRASAIDGVRSVLEGTAQTPEEQHEEWMRRKEVEGWVFGDSKDAEAKTHPCMVAYDDLPPTQRAKDHIFRAVVIHYAFLYEGRDGG